MMIPFDDPLKVRLFTSFTATGSRIPLLDFTLEFSERIQIFIFVLNLVPHKNFH